MQKTFHIYSPRTVAILNRLNDLGVSGRLFLAYVEGTAYPAFQVCVESSSGETGPILYFQSEESLRPVLEKWLTDAGGQPPDAGGRPVSTKVDRLEVTTIRLSAQQRAAVKTNGHHWMRSLIDKALTGRFINPTHSLAP